MPDKLQSHLPQGHPQLLPERTGVLIVNLGTPEGTDTGSIRRYLREFLSDRRVIELTPLLWQPILNLFILPFRPAKSAKAYTAIWDKQHNESPLKVITRAQGDALAIRFQARNIPVEWAMRYGAPSISEKMHKLADQGCNKIVVLALYPQYSATTSASVFDQCFRVLMTMRRQPAIRTVAPYHDHPLYIETLAQSVKRHIREQGWEPDVIVASFHGLPQEYFDAGDPYHCHCQKTGRLLREALGRDDNSFKVTFQSRFGPKEWLQPYTDKSLEALARQGVKNIMVVAPGFAADCVETLEELSIEAREIFIKAGGQRFSVVPCLNDHPDHITLLDSLIDANLDGWEIEKPQ